MKLKKAIARELLYSIGTLLLLVIVYGSFLSYSVYQQNGISKISNDISSINQQYQDFLSRPLALKYNDITQKKLDEFSNFIMTNQTATNKHLYAHFPELNNDSILLQAAADYAVTNVSQKYKHKKEQNLKFPEFFIFEKSDIDSINYFQSKIIILKNNKAKSKNNLLTPTDIRKYIYSISLCGFILMFGLRYLFYTTRWSLQTIKSKD